MVVVWGGGGDIFSFLDGGFERGGGVIKVVDGRMFEKLVEFIFRMVGVKCLLECFKEFFRIGGDLEIGGGKVLKCYGVGLI